MKYDSSTNKNKIYDFTIELINHFVLALCILLIGCLVMVFVFGFKPYIVLSPSEAPHFYKDDIVIVKAQKEYKLGDILAFNEGNKVVSHRLVKIFEDANGNLTYVCHGDAVQSSDGSDAKRDSGEYEISVLKDKDLNYCENNSELQVVKEKDAIGTVVATISRWGAYVNVIADHKLLFVTLVLAFWCLYTIMQNEVDIKQGSRLWY